MVNNNKNKDVIRPNMPKSIKNETLQAVIDCLKFNSHRYINKQTIRGATRLHHYSIGKALQLLESGDKLDILRDGAVKFYKWKNEKANPIK